MPKCHRLVIHSVLSLVLSPATTISVSKEIFIFPKGPWNFVKSLGQTILSGVACLRYVPVVVVVVVAYLCVSVSV